MRLLAISSPENQRGALCAVETAHEHCAPFTCALGASASSCCSLRLFAFGSTLSRRLALSDLDRNLLPGEMGAAAVQNIGAYGMEIKDVIERVEAYNQLSFEKRVFSREECTYGYRDSYFKDEQHDPYIITYVTIRLAKQPAYVLDYGNLRAHLADQPISLRSIREAVIAIRKEKLPDPDQLGNAGSFFKNPLISLKQFEELKQRYPNMPSYPASEQQVKVPAGWLIEACGFKGKQHGPVGVYEKQALVLVNLGEATGHEIALVAESIRAAVNDRFGIDLMPEVKYVS